MLSMITFVLSRASGSPLGMLLPPEATAEDYARVTKQLGLDQPYHVQYGLFLVNAIKGDFGTSLRARKPVTELIGDRLPSSIKLATTAMAITLLFGIPLGVVAAVNKGRMADLLARLVSVLGQSLPPFWIGIVFIELFSVRLELLPSSGIGGFSYYVLPSVTLAWLVMAGVTRLTRTSMLEVLDAEFVKLARVKGVAERVVVWRHALRNALIPVVTFAGMYFSILVTNAIVVEVIFSWPGIGRLAYDSIVSRDYSVIQGVVLTAAAIVVAVNLLIDLFLACLDPRIRLEGR